jgi:hypothetical protein
MNKRFLVIVLGALALLSQVGYAHREVTDDDDNAVVEKSNDENVDQQQSQQQTKDEEFFPPQEEVYTGPKDFNYCKQIKVHKIYRLQQVYI